MYVLYATVLSCIIIKMTIPYLVKGLWKINEWNGIIVVDNMSNWTTVKHVVTHSGLYIDKHRCVILNYEHLWNILLYNYFWVIPWRLSFKCRRFGVGVHLPAYEDGTGRVFRNVGI